VNHIITRTWDPPGHRRHKTSSSSRQPERSYKAFHRYYVSGVYRRQDGVLAVFSTTIRSRRKQNVDLIRATVARDMSELTGHPIPPNDVVLEFWTPVTGA